MDNYIFDSHNDMLTFFTIKKDEENIFEKYHNKNFRKGNVHFGVFNVWIDDYSTIQTRAREILTYGFKEIITSKQLKLIRHYNEFDTLDEKIQIIVGLEGIDFLQNADELYPLYSMGIRLVGLTWNHSNKFATSVTDKKDNGLSDEGRKTIKIMNELGIIIDISHSSDKTALEILQLSTAPVIASHSNVREIAPHKRNLSDELILKVAESGGTIGINAVPIFVSNEKNNQNLDRLIDHIDYIVNLVGSEHISFGFDFMDYFTPDRLSDFIEGDVSLKGLKNHGDLNNLISKLIERDYSEEDISKFTHKNIFRIIKKILK